MNQKRIDEILQSGNLKRIESFISGMQSGIAILHKKIDETQAENERLQGLLEEARDDSIYPVDEDFYRCSTCNKDLNDLQRGHAEDCPLFFFEELERTLHKQP